MLEACQLARRLMSVAAVAEQGSRNLRCAEAHVHEHMHAPDSSARLGQRGAHASTANRRRLHPTCCTAHPCCKYAAVQLQAALRRHAVVARLRTHAPS